MKKIVLTLLCAAWICGLNAEETEQVVSYVDLGLPSGTLWKSSIEEGLFTYEQAINQFGSELPTKEQWIELNESCQWKWEDTCFVVSGLNGDSIILPAAGYRTCNEEVMSVGTYGGYWSATSNGASRAWNIYFTANDKQISLSGNCLGRSILLVKAK